MIVGRVGGREVREPNRKEMATWGFDFGDLPRGITWVAAWRIRNPRVSTGQRNTSASRSELRRWGNPAICG